MTMRQVNVKITGVSPLLQNNPQTVDRFNEYAKKMAAINAKKARRTDEDYRQLRELEIRSKIFFDKDIGIYIPTTWLSEAIACAAFKVAKLSRDKIRGAMFTTENKTPLVYRDMNKVKSPEDIVINDIFRHVMILPQGQVRVVKAFPIFHEWSFSTGLEYEDTEIDPDSLTRIIEHTSRYGGFGDFRPTFGRAKAEIAHA
jgi:hypothetical protein